MSHPLGEPDVAAVQAGPGEGISHVEPDDIGVGLLTVLFAFVAIVVLLIVVLLQAWFYNWKMELQAQPQRNGPIDVQQTPAAIEEKQLQRIETYRWIDRKTQVRAIPIQRAMELVARDLAAESAAPAVPVKETDGK